MSFNINRNDLQRQARTPNSKTTLGNSVSRVYDSFKLSTWNLLDNLKTADVYTMSNWVLFKERWIANQTYQNTNTYNRGSIIMADLGASNFKNEPSYEHPCIVLVNNNSKVLVVPCSTGAFGRGYHDVIDTPAQTGEFLRNTGVQVGQSRWINKNRVINTLQGRASTQLLDRIDEFQLSLVPSSRRRTNLIKRLLEDNSEKQREINRLKLEKAQNQSIIEDKDSILEGLTNWFIEHEGVDKDEINKQIEKLLAKIAN